MLNVCVSDSLVDLYRQRRKRGQLG